MPDPSLQENIAKRRHPEWQEHCLRWRRLLDSYEGGDVYRHAIYDYDSLSMPVRNLIRHKREYPDPRDPATQSYLRGDVSISYDPAVAATSDDYSLRLARTPVPNFMAEVVNTHLSRLYSVEVDRDTDDPKLEAWWRDVDGIGTTVDEWVQDTLAPLLMVFGCLDVCCDHPAPPDGVEVVTRADEQLYNLDRCVASVILPENMVWWRLDRAGRRYEECLVCEYASKESREKVYRHWTASGWTLYDENGGEIDGRSHAFGRVPIVRLFDRRRQRCTNVGLPRYEGVADQQREYYNRDSELILSDTTQAHPLLQGPEDYVTPEGTVPIGPNWLLPKKKSSAGATPTYEGFEVIDFPKEGAESIRLNKNDIREAVDRDAKLTKPAGAAGTGAGTVGQSGISKRIDQAEGNVLLSRLAGVMQKAELQVAELALLVLYDGRPPELQPRPLNPPEPGPDEADQPGTYITYPRTFDLMAPEEYAATLAEFQAVVAASGNLPGVESELLCKLVRLMLPGKEDKDYEEYEQEIEDLLKAKQAERELAREAMNTMNEGTDGSAATGQPDQPDVGSDAGPDQPDGGADGGVES